MVILLYPLNISQSVPSGYSHSPWVFEVADTTLSGAVTMVTYKLQLNIIKLFRHLHSTLLLSYQLKNCYEMVFQYWHFGALNVWITE